MFSSNNSQVANDVKYIEDVCSVYLRTGTGSSQTVTTGIKENTGALVISKSRSAATDWAWYDTFRGATYDLVSNSTAAQTTQSQGLTSFNTDGHTWGTLAKVNTSGATYVDTVLKPTPKFFDVVTYTGNGVSGAGGGRLISHSLGSKPGFIIVKRTDSTGDWFCSSRQTGTTDYIASDSFYSSYFCLNRTNGNGIGIGESYIVPNTTQVDVAMMDYTQSLTNINGASYIMYVFAHNAGGFGLTGTDNVISCGSYTGNGSSTGPTITLGYEPQWVMVKRIDSTSNWFMLDIMRGIPNTPGVAAGSAYLFANTSAAEDSAYAPFAALSATGFSLLTSNANLNASGGTYIYIAIRRGPMKVPTDATKVFAIDTRNATTPSFVSNFPVDMSTYRAKSGSDWYMQSRLTPNYLFTNSTAAESASPVFSADQFAYNKGWASSGASIPDLFSYMFRRAPSFFDVVCYTGTSDSVGKTVNHNLGVVPELMIVKSRSATNSWVVYAASLGNTSGLVLNGTNAVLTGRSDFWDSTTPTSTVFSIGSTLNANTVTWVAYLFATCAGVSKCTAFTGTGTLQTINCGFTSGARFVLIKRTDSTGDWYVWDSARGISSSTDPYLLLNSTAAEVTSTNWVDTTSTGFQVTAASGNNVNISGASYIAFAVA
jgi:hypothetical protein